MARRAVRAEATKQRIREAAAALYREQPASFTLKAVAERAKTSVQTVLRLYGNKEGLLAVVLAAPPPPAEKPAAELPSDVAAAIRTLFEDYETKGDALTQDKIAGGDLAMRLKELAAARQSHRDWVEATFAAPLGARTGQAQQMLLFGLLAATDVYTWKLLRRDLGLFRRLAEMVASDMVAALLHEH